MVQDENDVGWSRMMKTRKDRKRGWKISKERRTVTNPRHVEIISYFYSQLLSLASSFHGADRKWEKFPSWQDWRGESNYNTAHVFCLYLHSFLHSLLSKDQKYPLKYFTSLNKPRFIPPYFPMDIWMRHQFHNSML